MSVSVFMNEQLIAQGALAEVVELVRGLAPVARAFDLLAFDDETGAQVDLPLREVEMPKARGRPALGVASREVTLLPRHWDWLATQPGGASAALRRLVEDARRRGRSERECRDAAFRFLTVMAGDRPGYEEAIRALYAGDRDRFAAESAAWPAAVREHGVTLAWPEQAA